MYASPLPQNRAPFHPAAMRALPVGAVRPRGWLRGQLEVQALGLTGHLDEFWPDVGLNCGWLGGDGHDWERPPYYTDGLVPLGYILDDQRLIVKANKYVSWALNSALPNGQFGPRNNDWWPRMVMLKVFMSYYEATSDGRVLDVMTNYFRFQQRMLPARPLENWGAARAADNLLAIHWLYNLSGDAFLPELAGEIATQTMDWAGLQADYQIDPLLIGDHLHNMATHVVNNAQGIKTPAVLYVQSGDDEQRKSPLRAIENLMRHHGQPNGIWSGDEHLNGTSPVSGTELCAVAEYMYSLEEMIRILGNAVFGDILEQVTYNAWPATFKPDMWAHQYDQQVNQVAATIAKRGFTDNSDDANIYGLEPHFGCCTANMHQGWPKFVKSLIMATDDDGLAVIAYAPCEARTMVADHTPVILTVDTDYPFDGRISIGVVPERPIDFPLLLRIPNWAQGVTVQIGAESLEAPTPGTFYRIHRTWNNGDQVKLSFPMRVRTQSGHKGLVSVFRGPLLFGLHMGEVWQQIRGVEPHADWEVYPTTPWNYGLLSRDGAVLDAWEVETRPLESVPFAPENAPVILRGMGRRIPRWNLVNNSADDIDSGPHAVGEEPTPIELIPYGATNLRIAAFPLTQAPD